MDSPGIISPRIARPQAPAAQVHFGGPGDIASAIVGKIDSNRIVELVSTDVISMILPRTYIEWSERGPDLARETAIRELAGLLSNIFLAGWFSRMFMNMLGRSVNPLNVHGIPGPAWINQKSLETFSQLYNDILEDPSVKTPAEARERFVRTILDRLVSADQKLGAHGLQVLGEQLDAAARKDVAAGLNHLKTGVLREEAKQELLRYYRPRPTDTVLAGTRNFSEEARQWNQVQRKTAHPLPAINGGSPKLKALLESLGLRRHHDDSLAFRKERLRLSLGDLKGRGEDLARWMDEAAHKGGLTAQINLLDEQGKPVLSGKKRATLLQEVKHMLEQHIDRATDFESKPPANWKEAARRELFGRSAAKGLLAGILPQMDEGLTHAAKKMKMFYTWMPVVLTVAAGVSVAFYNNYLTRKKYGGKNFFPGEKLPHGSGAPTAGPSFAPAPVNNGGGLQRSAGVFSQFRQYRGGQPA